MQTTLLGLSIAIILALLGALIGPLFVDWNDYRTFFETRASELVGSPVRIAGPIDARLLPSPSLSLRGVEARDAGGQPQFKAGAITVAFALGPLLRGEWRAEEMRLVDPEVSLTLDKDGRPQGVAGPENGAAPALSIDRFTVTGGRAVVNNAASASTIAVENVSFAGEVRSLAGPIKGEGSLAYHGTPHAFRFSAAGAGGDGSRRLRIALGGPEELFGADADGTLRFDDGVPRFEGNLNLARGAGVVMLGGRAVAQTPWRIAGRVQASPVRTVFEQLDVQYGAEERALKLGGAAELSGGTRPQIQAVLSARQLDLDRFLALPEETRGLPLAAARALAGAFEGVLLPDVSVRLGFGIDQVTLAGGTVQTLRGDVARGPEGWTVETLEFRAPGATQVRASGRVVRPADGPSFTGPVSIEARNPRALVAWLEGQSSATADQPVGALSAHGVVTLGPEEAAVEKLSAEIDHKTVTGRVAYARHAANGKPRLAADLKAAELDLDAASALFQKAFPGATLAVPGEVALGLDLGTATLAGVEAKSVVAKLTLDAHTLALDRLTVGDFAGTKLDARGRIEALFDAPRGGVTLDLTGNKLDGVAALLERAFPGWGAPLRSAAGPLVPVALRGALDLRPLAPGAGSAAKLSLSGNAGALRLDLSGEGRGTLAGWETAELRSAGTIDAPDGGALVRVLQLDPLFATATGPGALRWTASGSLGRDLRIEAQLKAAGFEAGGKGAIRVPTDGRWGGSADLSVTAADAVPFRLLADKPGTPAPLALKGRLMANGDYLALENLTGSAARTAVAGRVGIRSGTPARLDGRLDFDALPLAALVGAVAGAPVTVPAAAQGAAATVWAAEPFGAPLLGGLAGQLEIRAKRAVLTRDTAIEAMQSVLRPSERENMLEVAGGWAGGRLTANLGLVAGPFGRTATLRLSVQDADAAKALPPGAPVSGRLSLQGETTGSGGSAAALVASLTGTGTLSLRDGEIEGLDPRVFAVAIRAADAGTTIDPATLGPLAEKGLRNGRLRFGSVDAALTVVAGQLRASSFVARGEGADLAGSGSLDLSQGTLDARLSLHGPPSAEVSAGRPELSLAFKGPLASPERALDVSSLVGWLTLRSVELQARQLETLEAERRSAQAGEGPGASSAPGASVPAAKPLPRPEPKPTPLPPARPTLQPAPATPPARTPPATTSRDVGAPGAPARGPRRPASPPVSERAPALAPPLDIRPAPEPRRSGDRRGAPANRDWWDASPFSEPAGRPSGFDSLFGPGGR